jgi:23S rRNA pseudouridine1911/1915/1917 synthase
VIVVDKPAGVSTVPFAGDERPERGTLDRLVADWLGQRRVFVVQRLDRDTTGPIVFARTADAARSLSGQLRRHTVTRRYWALVHGALTAGETIRSELVADRGDGRRGSLLPGRRAPAAERRLAVTHVTPVARLGPLSLVECRLETGRTHQIRIHLAERGHPLVGERAYAPGGPAGGAERILLHAFELCFDHPTRGERRRFAGLPPEDFLALLDEPVRAELRRRVAG